MIAQGTPCPPTASHYRPLHGRPHTAALLSRAHPDVVGALVLEDPPWTSLDVPQPSEENARAIEDSEATLRDTQQKPVSQIVTEDHAVHPAWSHDELVPWAEAQKQFNMAVFSNGIEETRRRWNAVVQQLTAPTLLLTGENALGAIVNSEMAQIALGTMRGMSCKLRGCGTLHMAG
ncbi:hypothetical protein BC938DRAFT_470955 [Jimgerdemannia flammicorona]|uniref:Uncharacterized protein n=1 Tax=Jimgerdemannia flammicorona TaxID=994334 RepID=A0A433QV55_9FUNG|nr:hypothetical protein BC938DRAFT_470955 [Jimgerdemannia flammicorona]